jgi:transposase
MCESKTIRQNMSTKDFAKIANVTAKTVQGYCRDITKGNKETKKILYERYGLVSVTRYPDRWILTVDVDQ